MEKQWMESGLTGKKLAKIKNREIFEQKEKQFCKRKQKGVLNNTNLSSTQFVVESRMP